MSFYDVLLAQDLNKEGGSVTVEELNVTENGTFTAPSGRAYTPVVVNVPQPSGTISITQNGTVDVSLYESANVNIQPSGTIGITQNGTANVAGYATANVSVPSSFGDNVRTVKVNMTSGHGLKCEVAKGVVYYPSVYANVLSSTQNISNGGSAEFSDVAKQANMLFSTQSTGNLTLVSVKNTSTGDTLTLNTDYSITYFFKQNSTDIIAIKIHMDPRTQSIGDLTIDFDVQ